MTVMFDATTALPKRPNFFSYCARTMPSNVAASMSLSRRKLDTPKNAPRNALPCMRN